MTTTADRDTAGRLRGVAPLRRHERRPDRPDALGHLDDADLVRVARDGNEDALSALLERYENLIVGVCRRHLPPGDVDDACQETRLRVLRGIDQVREPARFAGWIRAIAVRVCLDIRQRRRRRHWLDPDVGLDLADADPGPEEVVVRGERGADLRARIATLSERDQRALWLRDAMGFPVAAVAGDLDVTEGSARVLLTRARRRLRATYSGLTGWLFGPWVGLRNWLRKAERQPALLEAGWAPVTQAALAAAVIVLLPVPGGDMAGGAPSPVASPDTVSVAPAAVPAPSVTTPVAHPSIRSGPGPESTTGTRSEGSGAPTGGPVPTVDLGRAGIGSEPPDDPQAGRVAIEHDIAGVEAAVHADEPEQAGHAGEVTGTGSPSPPALSNGPTPATAGAPGTPARVTTS